MTYLSHDQGLWFNNNHAGIAVAQRDNADEISVIKMTLPFDEAPPVHVHHEKEEVLHLLEGEIRFSVGGTTPPVRPPSAACPTRSRRHGKRSRSSRINARCATSRSSGRRSRDPVGQI